MFLLLAMSTLLVLCTNVHALSALQSLSLSHDQPQCASGFLFNTNFNKCECYPNSNVICSGNEAFLHFGTCMTYEERGRHLPQYLHIFSSL